MTSQPTKPQTDANATKLADCVLRRIESECITPTPRWQFMFSEYTMWLLWLLSIVIGAFAVAVMLYISVHASYALYEATHSTGWDFLVEVVPALWLLLFFLMAVIAYINIRHTKRGYRYPVWQILLSSLFVSVIGGGVLHLVGAGHVTDSFMYKTLPMYASFEAREQQWWQRPEAGVLVGRLSVTLPEYERVLFADVHNTNWRLEIHELSAADRELLQTGKLVKVIGVQVATSAEQFYGCAIFPWMYENEATLSDLRRERLEFVRKMRNLKRRVAEHWEREDDTGNISTTMMADQQLPLTVCASMPQVTRMP